ncbi:MAG: MarR family transcriptional regulator [Rhodobacteraceae bacterium]|nr:MarR family transcriptional regulator [Paracoccaceae bacterium]
MPGHLIRRLNQLSTQVFAARMRAIGIDLTPVQFAALDAIRATPGLDQAGIAAMIAYDRATIGGVIERLLQKGYVERTVSARDRRAREITMTKAGEAAYTRILPVVRDLQSDILSSLSEDEAQHLVSLMKKVVGA